jgi:hypothetical protein
MSAVDGRFHHRLIELTTKYSDLLLNPEDLLFDDREIFEPLRDSFRLKQNPFVMGMVLNPLPNFVRCEVSVLGFKLVESLKKFLGSAHVNPALVSASGDAS